MPRFVVATWTATLRRVRRLASLLAVAVLAAPIAGSLDASGAGLRPIAGASAYAAARRSFEMLTVVVYVIVGAMVALLTVGVYGFTRDSWRRSTTAARRAGLIVGFVGACSIAVGFALRQEAAAVIAAPPGLLLSTELAMRLVTWFEHRRGTETIP